ncbi:MAG TPA: lysylphosphatidylglycerol synthase transmembrane domain-containing protein [Gaiellaceae bacterium]
MRFPTGAWVRIALVVAIAALVSGLLWWRGPDWNAIPDAFQAVRWHWVLIAIGFNLLSIVVRSLSWQTVISQAMPPPRPRFPLVFSAFCVGLFANAVLPGRIGELARVAVLTRKTSPRTGTWATLVGTVFAHRVFDLIPAVLLIVYVLVTAKIPDWAITSLIAVVAVGSALFMLALASARRHHRSVLEEAGTLKRVVEMARQGLGVMHAPLPALLACMFQCLGWLCQFFAVYTAMRAFHIHAPLPAAGLVLVLMNVATIFPLWPGNIGLTQAAIALPLVQYGVAYARGFAFGIGLQAIEASVGVGVGLIFLGREGLSFAMLRRMPEVTEADAGEPPRPTDGQPAAETSRERARISG